jgi:hypothetical protein
MNSTSGAGTRDLFGLLKRPKVAGPSLARDPKQARSERAPSCEPIGAAHDRRRSSSPTGVPSGSTAGPDALAVYHRTRWQTR